MLEKLNDPISSLSHLMGAICSVPATIALVIVASNYGTTINILSFIIFGASLCALYIASTVYHLIPKTEDKAELKLKSRKVDHMMIYVLIAGSYTPICLGPLSGVWGYSLIAVIWILAIAGIVFKLFVLNDNKIVRAISTFLYVFMGWLAVVALFPLVKSVDTITMVLMVLGGVSYTIGAVVYALKKPHISIEWLGFHDVFHFFVLLGSMFHILMMFTII